MTYDTNSLDKELRLMEHIGGLELKHSPIDPLWIESFRRMEGLYQELCIARLNLLMATKAVYPDLVERDEDGLGDKMMQNSFAQMSIIWYNNCFDLLLQVIWVYYKVWTCDPKIRVSEFPSDWTLEQINLMKEYKYQYNTIEKWNSNNANKVDVIVKLRSSTLYKQVREWTNEIKHRAPLHVKGVSVKSTIRTLHFKQLEQSSIDDGKISINIELDKDSYDSGNAFKEYGIDEIISTLISYHKELCNCIDMIANPIIEEYKNINM